MLLCMTVPVICIITVYHSCHMLLCLYLLCAPCSTLPCSLYLTFVAMVLLSALPLLVSGPVISSYVFIMPIMMTVTYRGCL